MDAALAQTMREAADSFPAADKEKTALVAAFYAADPRNAHSNIVLDSLEREYRLIVPIDDSEPLVLTGHTDVIRREQDGSLSVWDFKLSRYSGPSLLNQYAFQLSLYAIAASQAYERPVRPGGIVCLEGYLKQQEVFFPCTYGLEDAQKHLEMLVGYIKYIRSGAIPVAAAGDHCAYCPAREIATCLRWFEDADVKPQQDVVAQMHFKLKGFAI